MARHHHNNNTQQLLRQQQLLLRQRLRRIDEGLECLQCERAFVDAELRAAHAREAALRLAELVATIVARIRAVAEAGGPMAALAMANDQLLPWRHWLAQYQQPAEKEAIIIPESFPSRWTREEALACLDAIATAVAASASAVENNAEEL
jgi:hypothetical protein